MQAAATSAFSFDLCVITHSQEFGNGTCYNVQCAGTLRGHDYTVHWLWCKHEECAFRWKTTKADLEAAYANELSEAKGSHQQHVSRIRRQWEKEQKVCCYLLQRMMHSGTARPP